MKTYVASAGWTSKPIQDWVLSLFQVLSRRVSLFGLATKLMFTADGGCALPCGHTRVAEESFVLWLSQVHPFFLARPVSLSMLVDRKYTEGL